MSYRGLSWWLWPWLLVLLCLGGHVGAQTIVLNEQSYIEALTLLRQKVVIALDALQNSKTNSLALQAQLNALRLDLEEASTSQERLSQALSEAKTHSEMLSKSLTDFQDRWKALEKALNRELRRWKFASIGEGLLILVLTFFLVGGHV